MDSNIQEYLGTKYFLVCSKYFSLIQGCDNVYERQSREQSKVNYDCQSDQLLPLQEKLPSIIFCQQL